MPDSKLSTTAANVISFATNDEVDLNLRTMIVKDTIRSFASDFANLLKNINETSLNEKDRIDRIGVLCENYGLTWNKFSNKFY